MKSIRITSVLILLFCGLFTACADTQPAEPPAISAEELTAAEIGRQILFDLYEKYNYELPQNLTEHYGFLLTIYIQEDDDRLTRLGYRDGKTYCFQYPRGVEFNANDPEAQSRYQPLRFDQNAILEQFTVVNHLTPYESPFYWNMMT